MNCGHPLGAVVESGREARKVVTVVTAAGLAQGQLGNLEEADRLSAEAVDVAEQTDSLSAADSWEVRAPVLWMLGRRDDMVQAATGARELHVAKGSVNFLRRLDRFLADVGPARAQPTS